MYIVAVANQKGGCGKTTTVMNLAGGFTKAQYRVQVVDADPQASAAVWSLACGQGSLPFDVVTARQLRGRFAAVADGDYDLALVDCPPGVTDAQDEAARFARQAICGCDAILVPLRPSTLDFAAAAAFVRYLEREKDPRTKTAVLINGRQRTRLGTEASGQAALLFAPIAGAIVLQSTIGFRAPITEVSGSGQTIFDYAPRHQAAVEYANLTKEILEWLSTAPHSTPTASQA